VFSPAEKLDVAGTVYADGFRGDDLLTITEAGNVGIGRDAPTHKLHVDDNAATGSGLLVTGGGGGTAIAEFTRDEGGTGTVKIRSAGNHPQINFTGASDSFSIGIEGTKFKISDDGNLGNNDRLTIDSTGNVGIGTTSPLRKLVAQGDAVTSGEHRIISAQTSNGNESISLGYDANGSIHSNAFVRTNNGRPLHLGTNTTNDAMVILDDGRIGMGTASPIANSLIEAEKTESSATSGTHYGLHVDYNLAPSSTLTGNMTGYGVYSIVDGVMDPSTFVNTLTSGYFYARHDTANIGHDASSVNGSWHLGYHLGSGTATSVRGAYAEGRATQASGAATNLYGIQAIGLTVGGNATTARGVDAAVTAQGGTITTARGVDSIINETSGGVITNGYAFYGDCNDATTCYGLFITASDPDVTTAWGVYVAGEDKNYFSGDVGIGDTTPSEALDVNGNVQAVAYLYSSDRTLKKNIEPLDNALEKIMALDGVGFDWREAARAEENGHQIGLIAQDVKKKAT